MYYYIFVCIYKPVEIATYGSSADKGLKESFKNAWTHDSILGEKQE